MADEPKLKSQLISDFADNVTGQISAQKIRNFVMSVCNYLPHVNKTAGYTVTTDDGVITCDTTSDFAITLPTASVLDGRFFMLIKTTSAGVLTITGTVSGVVNPTISAQYTAMQIYCDGTNYYFV
jgi:hypothetical protein